MLPFSFLLRRARPPASSTTPSGMSSAFAHPSAEWDPLPRISRVASRAAATPMSPSSAPALKSASRVTSDATAKLSAVGGAETKAVDAEDDVADSSSTSREM
eukprot:6316237-Prymnesium_polylepis.2